MGNMNYQHNFNKILIQEGKKIFFRNNINFNTVITEQMRSPIGCSRTTYKGP